MLGSKSESRLLVLWNPSTVIDGKSVGGAMVIEQFDCAS